MAPKIYDRSYCFSLAASILFTYVCIGMPGRRLRYVASDEADAQKLVRKTLRRRATARNRIGVPYRFRELIDPWQWLSLTPE